MIRDLGRRVPAPAVVSAAAAEMIVRVVPDL
jgi:hypothetical protein